MLSEPWQRNLAVLWIAQTLTILAFSVFFPFLPLYIQFLGVSGEVEAAQWAGVIGAASALSLTAAQPIWGSLGDRWGRKPMVMRSMIGAAIVTALTGVVTSPEQLLAMRLLQGAVSGTVAAATALVATTTPGRKLGFAMGLMQVAIFVGMSVGPLLGGLIADHLGYRVSFFVAAALMLVGAVIVGTLVTERFTPPTPGERRRGILAEGRSLMAIALFPVMVGTIFLLQFGNTVVTPILSLFIAGLSGGENPATAAGMVMAATGVSSAISALLLGRLGDRIGHMIIVTVCLAGSAICCFPQAQVYQVWELLALRALLGLFLGGLMPGANALVASIVPRERRGAAFGLTAAASALAHGVGPLSGAAIATWWDMRAVFVATGALYALAFGWIGLSLRRHGSTQPRPGVGTRLGNVAGGPRPHAQPAPEADVANKAAQEPRVGDRPAPGIEATAQTAHGPEVAEDAAAQDLTDDPPKRII